MNVPEERTELPCAVPALRGALRLHELPFNNSLSYGRARVVGASVGGSQSAPCKERDCPHYGECVGTRSHCRAWRWFDRRGGGLPSGGEGGA